MLNLSGNTGVVEALIATKMVTRNYNFKYSLEKYTTDYVMTLWLSTDKL